MEHTKVSTSIDPILEDIIRKMPQLQPINYSTKDQLAYLKHIAVKFGLYDAADTITKTFQV